MRDDEGRRPTQMLERGKVQVIVVKVGGEYLVESVAHPNVCWCCTPEMRHPAAEYGVGQEPHAIQLDQDRAVAEPGYARRIGSLLAHLNHVLGGRVPVPLVTEIGEPTARVLVHLVEADDGLRGQAPACGHDD